MLKPSPSRRNTIDLDITPMTLPTATGTVRGQMAAFLVMALDHPDSDPSIEFTDDDGSASQADIEKLATAGIATGCGGDRFCPNDPVTRGQMAAFLRRALNN